MIRTVWRGGWGVLALVLAACVTINVYFPAAAVEKAADRIIEDVWGQQPPSARSQPRSDAPDASESPSSGSARPGSDRPSTMLRDTAAIALLARTLDVLILVAEAQQADINVSTPAIERLKQSLSSRFPRLQPYFDSGAVGLTDDGLVAVRDLDTVPLNERNRVQQLVQQENQDRKALYREIAKANGHPEWENDIRDVFAQRWIGNARSGWWYQRGGSWRRK